MTAPPRHRLEFSLADAVTCAGAVCGFLAVALVLADSPGTGRLDDRTIVVAGALIVGGGLLDSIDGAIARWRGGSGLGEYLETMADIITFGVAPAVVFAVDARSYDAPWDGLSLAVGAGYMVAAALRLARYASTRDGGGHTLVGLPSPPAAMAAVALIVLHPPAPVALAAFLALAAFMIAGFPFPTITGLIVPFMAFWWTLAAGAAVGLVSPRVVAFFTLAVITSVLVLLPGHRALRRL